jgi:hypothetical protein
VKRFGEGWFFGSLIESVDFESEAQISVIVAGAFQFSGKRRIRIPAGVCQIGDGCFVDFQSLESVEFERNFCLTKFGEDLFPQSSLRSIMIPLGVEVLEYRCCCYCRRPQNVILGEGSRLQELEGVLFVHARSAESSFQEKTNS